MKRNPKSNLMPLLFIMIKLKMSNFPFKCAFIYPLREENIDFFFIQLEKHSATFDYQVKSIVQSREKNSIYPR